MYCPKCNKEISEDAKFCPDCGTPLTDSTPAPEPAPMSEKTTEPSPAESSTETQADFYAPPTTENNGIPYFQSDAPSAEIPPQKNAKKAKKKRGAVIVVSILVALIAVIAVAGMFIVLLSSHSSDKTSEYPSWNRFYISEKDLTIFTVDGHYLEGVTVKGNANITGYSQDSKTVLALTKDGVLYVVSRKEAKKVANDAYSAIISADGTTIAYRDDSDVLYYFTVRNEKKEKVASDVKGNYTLSPNGKCLVYSTEAKSSKYTTDMKLYRKGESETIANDGSVIAVSNNADYIYWLNEENTLYVSDKKGEKEKISADVENGIILNQDYTEILFHSGGNTYISKKGGSKETVAKDAAAIPVVLYDLVLNQGYLSLNENFTIAPVKSLLNRAYFIDNSLYYVDKNLEKSKISAMENNTYFQIHGNNIYYIKGSSLYRAELKADSSPEKITSDVQSFETCQKNGLVFYLNDDDELWRTDSTGKGKKIADKVKDYKISDNGQYAYVLDSNDCLILLFNQKETRIALDVQKFNISSDGKSLAYIEDGYSDNGNLYFATAGEKGKKVESDVTGMTLSEDGTELLYTTEDGKLVIVKTYNGFEKITKFKYLSDK